MTEPLSTGLGLWLSGAAGAGVLSGLGLGLGLFHPRVTLFGPVIWRGPTDRPRVALTFDDGPHPEYTPRIAETLRRFSAPATFFCIGREAERHAGLARELVAAGHELANHTYSHETGRMLFSERMLTDDLRRCRDTLESLSGAASPYYRPAVGIRNPPVHAAAKALGLSVVTWTGAARDGAFPLEAHRAARLADRSVPGSILVLHDGLRSGRSPLREKTVASLPRLLERLEERGLEPVTLSTLLSRSSTCQNRDAAPSPVRK